MHFRNGNIIDKIRISNAVKTMDTAETSYGEIGPSNLPVTQYSLTVQKIINLRIIHCVDMQNVVLKIEEFCDDRYINIERDLWVELD